MRQLLKLIRAILSSKYRYELFWRRYETLSDKLNGINFVPSKVPKMIIVSTGRTGTLWLAKLLDNVDSVCSVHEPILYEQFAMNRAMVDSISSDSYADFRVKYIEVECIRSNCAVYVEANGALRRHVASLKKLQPEIYIPFIIRDGRDVVTSVMNRTSGTKLDPYFRYMHTGAYGYDLREWRLLSKFERCCIMWASDNEYMAKHCDRMVKFEDMMNNYNEFMDAFCRPLSISISEEDWSTAVHSVQNANPVIRFASCKDWSEHEQKTFKRLCGATMEKFGYPL